MAGQGRACRILDLDADIARGRRGEVERECAPLELERPGDEFAADHGRADGDEPVETQRVAAQLAAGAGPVTLAGVE